MSGHKGYRRMRKAMRREDARAFEAFMENHNLELAQREAEEAKAQRAEDEAFADRFLAGMISGLDPNEEEARG